MITKFLSKPININALILLITYLICYIAYDTNTTLGEAMIFFFLLTFNNILMYVRGLSKAIRDEMIRKELNENLTKFFDKENDSK